QACRLRLQALVDPGISLKVPLMRTQPGLRQALGQAVSQILEVRIVRSGVFDQPSLMELRAPRNQGRNQGGSHAASDIAHEVNDSGDRVVFLRRNSDVGHKSDWHEQESQTKNLSDA